VRLALSPAQRLVGQDQFLVNGEIGNGEEKPLALADEGGVLAAVAGLGTKSLAGLGAQNLGGILASAIMRRRRQESSAKGSGAG